MDATLIRCYFFFYLILKLTDLIEFKALSNRKTKIKYSFFYFILIGLNHTHTLMSCVFSIKFSLKFYLLMLEIVSLILLQFGLIVVVYNRHSNKKINYCHISNGSNLFMEQTTVDKSVLLVFCFAWFFV